MRKLFLSLLLLFCLTAVFPQPFIFNKHIIDSSSRAYAGLYSGDIDRDGYPDIAGTSLNDNKVIIWMNNGKINISWKKIIIDSSFLAPLYISISDINKDRNPDLIAGSGVGEIAWWQNDNKNISKWTKHIIDTGFAGAHGILACDMNNDGHTDILASSSSLHSIAWWENQGNDPPSWSRHTVCINFHTSQSCYAIDIDNDGDIDVLGASSDDDEIAVWYNIDGIATEWKKQTITDSFDLAHWVYSCNLDNDGDNDIIGAACIDGEVTWWENNGQIPPSWTKHETGKDFACALTALAADFNNDSYPEIYASAWMDNEISIWQNPCNNNSGWIKHIVDSFVYGAWPIHANDFDNDGDIDLIAGGNLLNRQGNNPPLCWWENKLITVKPERDLSKDRVLNELEIIHTSLKELHPGLTLYITKKDLELKYDSIKTVINKSEKFSKSECLLLYRDLCNYINCGHTAAYDPTPEGKEKITHKKKPVKKTEIETVEDGICKLILPTFYTVELRKKGIHYKKYLDSFFREAKKKTAGK